MFTSRRVATLAVILALTALGCSAESSPESGKRSIAVIPKGTTHVFWKSVEAGARQAGEEFGVEITWKGPLKENDRAQQIQIVEQFATEGVAGIVIAPLDDQALLRPVRAASRKDIPVAIIDSALNGDAGQDFITFASTDNRKGGFLGGEELARLLGGPGKVVLLRYQVGSASTDNREAGFIEAIGQSSGVQLTVDNQYGGATVDEALRKAEELLDQLKAADGVFTPNESTTTAMLKTLQRNGLVGRLKFVGFDASPVLVEALRQGEIDALVVQNPRKMGYEGVKAIVHHLDGQKIDRRIDTGVRLVTQANMDDPEIKPLLGG